MLARNSEMKNPKNPRIKNCDNPPGKSVGEVLEAVSCCPRDGQQQMQVCGGGPFGGQGRQAIKAFDAVAWLSNGVQARPDRAQHLVQARLGGWTVVGPTEASAAWDLSRLDLAASLACMVLRIDLILISFPCI